MSDQKDAENLYRDTVKLIDKAASKGLIKKNTASRRKSRITRRLNSISK